MGILIQIDFGNGAPRPEEPPVQPDAPLRVGQTASRLLELRGLLRTDINTTTPEDTLHRIATLAWELEQLRLGATLPEENHDFNNRGE